MVFRDRLFVYMDRKWETCDYFGPELHWNESRERLENDDHSLSGVEDC